MSVVAPHKTLSQRVNAVIERALAERRLVGGVVLIAQDGDVVYRRAAGLADREAKRPMREDAIFRFSSLTKPIVSAAAMALVERGQLALDTPTTQWLPTFRPKLPDGSEPAITIRQLLTHTAGLSYSFFQPADGPYQRAGVSDGIAEPGLSIEEELERLARVPLSYAPGAAWGYSVALDVLGEIIARAGGAALPAIVEQLVTAPLRMADTGFAVRDLGRLAVSYVDGAPPRRMGDPDVVAFGDGAGIRFSPSRILDAASFASGGAGMAGTAADFLAFLETLRRGGGGILTPDSVRAMMSNQIGALRINTEVTPSWGFGFGGAVLIDPILAGTLQSIGTWKWGGVYGHHWFVDAQRRLTLAALSNTAIEGMAGNFVGELRNAVYDAPSPAANPSV
ncbi:serine hydrolase [Methylocapsa sp. S129]|uniref:serine hydrolase domain-containing protein n=1 Tax=Methylocapsa sp. S129 TaxID=1641869 RepID=UPI00131C0A94|nr:serine hydrolase domain-containing protein [Methylocapsa sp. S129]